MDTTSLLPTPSIPASIAVMQGWQPACRRFPHSRSRLSGTLLACSAGGLPLSMSTEFWAEQLAACGLALAYACWLDRPQGWADSNLIEVPAAHISFACTPKRRRCHACIRCSMLIMLTSLLLLTALPIMQVRGSPVHGQGVFAKVDIPSGTVLGAYPGRARTPAQVVRKVQHAPSTKGFVFLNGQGLYLDPTDASGAVSSRPGPGLPWLAIDPTLAFMNEPQPGRGVNVSILDEGSVREVRFVAAQDMQEGDELYIDYGGQYDRSGYMPQ